jgi:hypothetical protein
MITFSIPLSSGEITRNGILMIYNLNGSTYVATIRIKDDDTPYPVDIALYAADIHEDESFDLYEITDEEEYAAATEAFIHLQSYI